LSRCGFDRSSAPGCRSRLTKADYRFIRTGIDSRPPGRRQLRSILDGIRKRASKRIARDWLRQPIGMRRKIRILKSKQTDLFMKRDTGKPRALASIFPRSKKFRLSKFGLSARIQRRRNQSRSRQKYHEH